MGRFNKGVFLGALIGAAAMWMQTTSKGKETKDQLFAYGEEVYEEVEKRVKANKTWKKMTEQEYVALARQVVKEFSDKRHLSPKTQQLVLRLVKHQWKHLKKILHAA